MNKHENALAYLNSLPQHIRDAVWEELLGEPVEHILERSLRLSKASHIQRIVVDKVIDSKFATEALIED